VAFSFASRIITPMHCPFCPATDTKVIDSRLSSEGTQVRRRRECLECGERFNTYETAELEMPHVIKSDGTRVAFDEHKLRAGLDKALEKRPVEIDAIDNVVSHLKNKARAYPEKEIPATQIGEWVMDELRILDEVAYVRFASVYRSFQDVDEFSEEIKKLQNKTKLKRKVIEKH